MNLVEQILYDFEVLKSTILTEGLDLLTSYGMLTAISLVSYNVMELYLFVNELKTVHHFPSCLSEEFLFNSSLL